MDVSFAELASRKLGVRSVDVSEWFSPGAKMYVRELSAVEAMKAASASEDDQEASWFTACLCDKQGKQLVPDGEPLDQSSLPAGLFRIIVEAAVDLNCLGGDDAEKN